MRNFFYIHACFLLIACAEKNEPEDNNKKPEEIQADISARADSLKAAGYNVFTYKEGETEFLMQEYYMVRLLSGPNDTIPKTELEKLQTLHMEYLGRMYEEGYASLIGPMSDGGNWRGIVVFNTPTLRMADSLANLDPYVKSGALKVETTGWYTQKEGTLR
jgi:uncharacterized protein YciI